VGVPSPGRGAGTIELQLDLSLTDSAFAISLLATLVGLGGAALGLWLTSLRRRARMVVPFSAGVLVGVALFGLVPELAEEAGWTPSLLLFAIGFAMLFLINRYIYPVCPTCAHDHDHNSCDSELHGFAGPLVAGAALHCFLDGWGIATSQWAATPGLRIAVPLAVAMHKLPEGIALGGILFAAVKRRPVAMGWCTLAEGATLLGGAAGLFMAPNLGTRWTMYPLGLTAGWLFFLGCHAVHEEWKRRGTGPAFLSAGAGILGSAVIQRGAELLFR
jgi:zinc transporter ZupT